MKNKKSVAFDSVSLSLIFGYIIWETSSVLKDRSDVWSTSSVMSTHGPPNRPYWLVVNVAGEYGTIVVYILGAFLVSTTLLLSLESEEIKERCLVFEDKDEESDLDNFIFDLMHTFEIVSFTESITFFELRVEAKIEELKLEESDFWFLLQIEIFEDKECMEELNYKELMLSKETLLWHKGKDKYFADDTEDTDSADLWDIFIFFDVVLTWGECFLTFWDW